MEYAWTNDKTPTIQLRSVLFNECFMFPGKDRLYLVIRPPSGYAGAVRKSLVVDLASGNAEFVDDNMQVIPVDTFTTISPAGPAPSADRPVETPPAPRDACSEPRPSTSDVVLGLIDIVVKEFRLRLLCTDRLTDLKRLYGSEFKARASFDELSPISFRAEEAIAGREIQQRDLDDLLRLRDEIAKRLNAGQGTTPSPTNEAT